MGQAHRFSGAGGPYEGLTTIRRGKVDWTGVARFVPKELSAPLSWRKPRRVFVASMSDPFHSSIPDEDIDRIYAAMVLADWHTYQLLTKRPTRMMDYTLSPNRAFLVQRAADALRVDMAMSDVQEEWRPVSSHTKYEVSNYGKVRRGGRELTLVEHGGGYKQVALSNGSVKTVLVHRLVLEAFDRPPRDKEEGAHSNGRRWDNRIANLRWATKTENMQDAARQGTAGVWMKSQATLSTEEVDDIRESRARGEKLSVVAARFGITKQQVSEVALGKTFKKPQLVWPLPRLWLGVSVEDQKTADERIPLLLQTPAAIRFVSYEPALATVDFRGIPANFEGAKGDYLDALSGCEYYGQDEPDGAEPTSPVARRARLDLVIVGGESSPGARPFSEEWASSVVKQCRDAGVAAFIKQMGSNFYRGGERVRLADKKGGDMSEWSEDLRIRELPEIR
jgi:protein gp37